MRFLAVVALLVGCSSPADPPSVQPDAGPDDAVVIRLPVMALGDMHDPKTETWTGSRPYEGQQKLEVSPDQQLVCPVTISQREGFIDYKMVGCGAGFGQVDVRLVPSG